MTDEPVASRISLVTNDGLRLVAEHFVPPAPVAAAAIAHPHPQFGGSMHDAVVDTLWRTLGALGIATVRFSFRGTGGSEGVHGGGEAERLDVLAALDHAASLAPGLPVLACGYSFGADVTLTCDHPAVAAWLVVAPPLAVFDPSTMVPATDERPAHLFVAAHDQYAPPAVIRDRVAAWPAATVHVIESTDHFFAGAHTRLATAFRASGEGITSSRM